MKLPPVSTWVVVSALPGGGFMKVIPAEEFIAHLKLSPLEEKAQVKEWIEEYTKALPAPKILKASDF